MKSIIKKSRKGAIELSMATIVVIVLSMTMLALGLTLVRTLFSGAQITSENLNTQIQSQLNKVFSSETSKVGIVSVEGKLELPRGKDSTIWWGLATDKSGTYDYKLNINALNCATDHSTTSADIAKWFAGTSGQITSTGSEDKTNKIIVSIPDNAPSCLFTIEIVVTKDGKIYGSDYIYIRPKKAGLFG